MTFRRVACVVLVGGLCGLAPSLTARQKSAPAGQTAPTTPATPSTSNRQTGAPAPPASGQASAPDQAPPTFRAGINFVRVDVIVSDKKGEPVADLTAKDFEVFEDNAPQTVEQFKLIKVDGNMHPGDDPVREIHTAYDEEREVGREDVRLFVIFFDDYHTRDISALSVKRSLTQFVQTLGPKDLVGMMYPLTPVDAISFTHNPETMISAINHFEGRKYKYEPRNMFEERYAHYPTEEVERIRNQVVMTALRGLATRLGSLREGRKAILYVSEGLGAMMPAQMRFADALAPIPQTARPDSPYEDSVSFFDYGDLMQRLQDVFDAANRNNAAFYPIDPRGLATGEFHIDEIASPQADRQILQQTQDTLRAMAESTDGRAIVGRNDLVKGLAQIVKDSSAYYLLGYTSSQAPADGKFHEIKVRLADRVKARGLQVRTRKGYIAPTREDVQRALAPPKPLAPQPVQQALASMAQPGASTQFVRSWIGLSRGDAGKTRVTYVWEPLPTPPGTRREVAGRVAVLAATPAGDLVFRGAAQLPVAAVAGGTAAPPHGALVSFDVVPGTVELRLSVEGASGGVIDREVREIVVPDLAASAVPAMSTPRVFRARTVREVQAVLQDGAAVPLVGRDFSRAEHMLLRLDLYGGAEPTAALLNRAGQKMADVPMVRASAGGTHQLDLPLGALAAGEYMVEITATGGGAEVKSLVPIKVGN